MYDHRIRKLAHQLIHDSIGLKAGEKILLDVWEGADDFADALCREAYLAGGMPFLNLETAKSKRAWLMGLTEPQAEMWYLHELARMKEMDAYIAIRKQDNPSELADIPEDKMVLFNKYHGMLHLMERVRNTRWCVLRYPSSSMAQQAKMSSEAFEDYYFDICCLDYGRLSTCMDPLKELMDRTALVEVKAAGTHLTFSMKDCISGKCDGHVNIPDGEVCTSVEEDSVNGTILYNIPSNYQGFVYHDIKLTFRDGRIVEATANDSSRLNRILDIDEGARCIGEFAIGVNPYVNRPIIDTLFDEKMTGSIHLAAGYGGKTPSAIHWDMVQCQTPEYGGGEIWFDGRLIRKDGLFVVDELLALNPDEFLKTEG